ncbi:hypothetical protein QYM46_13190 [Brevibacterium sp. K11IcPPYGO002]|uniref:hypothetical protein n=1 Tax=Brevibacterium sp. K11IcPPYGO002 TaxID=3058837 RepID=UPI003D819EEA
MDNQQPFRFKFRVRNLTSEAEDDLAESSEMYFSQHMGVDFIICYEHGEDAVLTARQTIAKLRNHYVRVERLEPDLVTRAEIADRANVKRQAVSLWVTGQRKAGFPFPAVSYGGGLWYWPDVEAWLVTNDVAMHIDERQPSMAEIDTVNDFLNQQTALPDWSGSPAPVTTLLHTSGVVNAHWLIEQRLTELLPPRAAHSKSWGTATRSVRTGRFSRATSKTEARP